MAVRIGSCVHPTACAAGDGGGNQCVLVLCFCYQAGVWVFTSVSLKLFKTHLKVELLFLDRIKRVLLEGLGVQE